MPNSSLLLTTDFFDCLLTSMCKSEPYLISERKASSFGPGAALLVWRLDSIDKCGRKTKQCQVISDLSVWPADTNIWFIFYIFPHIKGAWILIWQYSISCSSCYRSFFMPLGKFGIEALEPCSGNPSLLWIRSGKVINTVKPSEGFFLKRYTLCEKCVWGQFGLKSVIIGIFLVSSIGSICVYIQ